MKNLLFYTLTILLLVSCSPTHNGPEEVKVHTYKQAVTDDNGLETFLFWYIIMNANGSYSYYSSPTPVYSYTNVTWTTSPSLPNELPEQLNVEALPAEEIAVEDLSAEMQETIDTTAEDYGGMTEDEMGDYEDGTESTDTDSGSDYSDASSDSGGDSGGGDF